MRKYLFVLLIFLTGSAFSYERNLDLEADCINEHSPSGKADYYPIESMLKSACAQRLYGSPREQHLGTCMLARLTLAVTEKDVTEAIMYCRTTNGWE